MNAGCRKPNAIPTFASALVPQGQSRMLRAIYLHNEWIMKRELAIEFSRVTEAAALAGYKWLGGDKNTPTARRRQRHAHYAQPD